MQVTAQVYPWQQSLWNNLTQRFPEIGHGLLFYGKAGCGKAAFCQAFIQWVLCHARPAQQLACGQCASCQWFLAGTHPNYVHVTTDEDNKKANAKIKIEKIRDLQPFVQQKVEGWRVVLIEPAEALNISSANSLLKTLEEPGEQVLIILLAAHPTRLAATIRSRMQHFALDRVTPSQTREYVQQALPEIHPMQQQVLINLSQGMPLQSVALADMPWLQQRQAFMDDWKKLVSQKNMPMAIAAQWQKTLNSGDFLQMFEYLLADLVAAKLSQPIKNLDLDFSGLMEHYQLADLFDIYQNLQQAKQWMAQNVQGQFVIEQLCIKLMHA